MAVLKVASDIFSVTNTGYVTVLALLDLSATFDTVDYDILLQGLQHTVLMVQYCARYARFLLATL